jgi:hypothetical protein
VNLGKRGCDSLLFANPTLPAFNSLPFAFLEYPGLAVAVRCFCFIATSIIRIKVWVTGS